MKPADNPQRRRLLERIDRVLACPHCRIPIGPAHSQETFVCAHCGSRFEVRNEQYVFWDFPKGEVEQDRLNRVKEFAKRRLGPRYPTALRLIAPVLGRDLVTPFLASFDTESELVADLGCGTIAHHERAVCVDGVDYPNVHVVANLEHLPFQNDSLDGIISVAVLEHARHPAAQVAEMQRVLRPGGRALCFVPFMQGYHASPHDYQRYTKNGLCELFGAFEIVGVRVGAGPTSALLWIFQEWLALVLSFGSVRLYRILLPCTWVLSPFKYVDLLLWRHAAAMQIASGHYIEVRKGTTPAAHGGRGAGPAIDTR